MIQKFKPLSLKNYPVFNSGAQIYDHLTYYQTIFFVLLPCFGQTYVHTTSPTIYFFPLLKISVTESHFFQV